MKLVVARSWGWVRGHWRLKMLSDCARLQPAPSTSDHLKSTPHSLLVTTFHGDFISFMCLVSWGEWNRKFKQLLRQLFFACVIRALQQSYQRFLGAIRAFHLGKLKAINIDKGRRNDAAETKGEISWIASLCGCIAWWVQRLNRWDVKDGECEMEIWINYFGNRGPWIYFPTRANRRLARPFNYVVNGTQLICNPGTI